MIKLITFTNTNEKLLEFNFNEPIFEIAPRDPYWITVVATKQILTICGNSLLAYDDSLTPFPSNSFDFSLTKNWIQQAYRNGDKILLISSPSDEPLFIFNGATVGISNIKNGFAEFTVDDKKIFINNLHWIVLTHNE